MKLSRIARHRVVVDGISALLILVLLLLAACGVDPVGPARPLPHTSATPTSIGTDDVPDLTLLPAFTRGAPGAGACVQGITADKARALIGQWNAAISAAVTKYGAILVDLYHSDLVAHPEYVSSDGFHPSSAGYARLADLFWAQMQAHGGLPVA
jgi:hypothetical protein